MAHDGQMMTTDSPVLEDLLTLTGEAVAPVQALLETAKDRVREMVTENGRVSGTLIEQHQTAAHGLAWLATYAESLREMQAYPVRLLTSFLLSTRIPSDP